MATTQDHTPRRPDKLSPDKALDFSLALSKAAIPVIRRTEPRVLSECMDQPKLMQEAIQGMLQGMVPRYDFSNELVIRCPHPIRLINRTKLHLDVSSNPRITVYYKVGDGLWQFRILVYLLDDPNSRIEFPSPYVPVSGKHPFAVSLDTLMQFGEISFERVLEYITALYLAKFSKIKIMPKRLGSVVSETEFQLCLRCAGVTYFADVPPELAKKVLTTKRLCTLC